MSELETHLTMQKGFDDGCETAASIVKSLQDEVLQLNGAITEWQELTGHILTLTNQKVIHDLCCTVLDIPVKPNTPEPD